MRGRATVGLPGRDVDLLVRKDHLASFEDVVFEHGGFMLPARSHPWHRFYILSDPTSGIQVELDVVTELIYNRGRQLASGLEGGCLDRRVKDQGLYVLDPSDMFWTVLLHCVLDKQKVTERRAAELERVVDSVGRTTPGEDFFRAWCPPGWSPERALACVHHRDWESLAQLGRDIVPSDRPASPVSTARPSAAKATLQRPRRAARRVARAAYPVLWRRAGLGAVPRVLDVLETGSIEGTVLTLRRRPALCDVELLVAEGERRALEALLRAARYVSVGGGWNRLTTVGVERVRLVSGAELAPDEQSYEFLQASSLPIAGRTYCRRGIEGNGRQGWR